MIKYVNIPVPKGDYKISPSGVTIYRRNPKEWLNNLEGNSTFKGNKATIYGTLVHYVFESVFHGRTDDCFWKDVKEYAQAEVRKEVINNDEYISIIETLELHYHDIKDWAMDVDESSVIESETQVEYQIPVSLVGVTKNNYHIKGSLDAIVRNELGELGIRDYKTSSRKNTSLDKYLHQLVMYTIAYNQTAREKVTYVEVINVYNLKKGVQFNVIRKYITKEHIIAMSKLLKEIVTVHQVVVKNPKLRNYIYRKGVDFNGQLDTLGS